MNIICRLANIDDCEQYFVWANDYAIRKNSFSSDLITWDTHKRWFHEKISKSQNRFYIFQNEINQFIGQVRIEQGIHENLAVIGLSIGAEFRGLGLGRTLLEKAISLYVKEFPLIIIEAYIKLENKSSQIIFEKSGFTFHSFLVFNNCHSALYRYYANR
jgi:RimJ/RimL family protein N-acetyltransferase